MPSSYLPKRKRKNKLVKRLFLLFIALLIIFSSTIWKYIQRGNVDGIIYHNFEDRNFLKEKIEYFANNKPYCHNLVKRIKGLSTGAGIARHKSGDAMIVQYKGDGKLFMEGRTLEFPLQQFIASLLKEGDTYVEIGANHGNIALNAAQAVGSKGKVYAYEPTSGIGDVLLPLSACMNGYDDMFYSDRLAMGEANKSVKFNEGDGRGSYCNILVSDDDISHNDKITDAQMVTLDSLHASEKINLLRLDVQGSECNIFKGAKQVLKHPDLIVSFEWEPALLKKLTKNFDANHCIGYLQDAGFKYFWEVKGDFKSDGTLEDSNVRAERVDIDEIISMTSGDREFIASKKLIF